MDIFIIRHGQSYNNALEDVSQRLADPPLTEIGEQQAERVGPYIAAGGHLFPAERDGRPILDHLYTSAMIRTMQTAQPISKALGLAAEIWVDIHEHGGIYLEHRDERGTVGYPGLGRSALLERFPGYVLPDDFSEDGWWDVDKGAESVHVAHGRAIGVAAALHNRRSENSRIGLVSHGGFIDSLLKALFDLLPSPSLALEHQNTAITRLVFSSDGKIAMEFMNHTEHLPDELLT